MKLITYKLENRPRTGLLIKDKIYDLNKLSGGKISSSMRQFLSHGDDGMKFANKIYIEIINGNVTESIPSSNIVFLAPIPDPVSCRDAYAFRQHVETARRNRGVPMIPEFDQYPIFYFTNHNAITGQGDVFFMPDHFKNLDFELEIAIVIGKKGRNIKASEADQYIAGYTIMNDWSARELQMEEMKLNLGPAKGKDFCTSIGPWLVTPDELVTFETKPKINHVGKSYNLKMFCYVNGIKVSEGNFSDMDWTFAEIIERCSYGCDIFPGDLIGSGTVGTGCFLELNGTGLLNDKNYPVQWLKENDVVEMEITGLGKLKNVIKREQSDFSILDLKKC